MRGQRFINEGKRLWRAYAVRRRVAAAIAPGLARRSRQAPRPGSVLIMPPWSPGSLGDEAMVTGVVAGLRARGVSDLGLVSYERDNLWELAPPVPSVADLHDFLLGGKTVSLDDFATIAADYAAFVLLGADTLDGHYSPERTVNRLRCAELAARLGLETRVLGFSFNSRPHPSSVRALRDLPPAARLYARDVISHSRLEKELGRGVEQAADLAFLLQPATSFRGPLAAVEAELARRKAAGELLFAVNLNPLTWVGRTDALVESYRAMLERYLRDEPSAHVVFVSHDSRGVDADQQLAARVATGLPGGRSTVLPGGVNSAEIKGLCRHFDFAFTGRMHFAIACLGMDVPPVALSYQGKFEGLYTMFGILPLLVEDLADFDAFEAKIRQGLADREALRRQIRSRRPEIERLSNLNLDGLGPATGRDPSC
jgi:polysaccharide pyruvyl transferase WcaK-like protein